MFDDGGINTGRTGGDTGLDDLSSLFVLLLFVSFVVAAGAATASDGAGGGIDSGSGVSAERGLETVDGLFLFPLLLSFVLF